MEKSIQPQKYDRLSFQTLKKEVLGHFYLERGIGFTFYMMLSNPENLLTTYLHHDRGRVFNPFRYLLIGVAISTILFINHPGFMNIIINLQDPNFNLFKTLGEKVNLPLWDILLKTQELYISYQNVLIIISLPAISWVTWKYFRISQFNYAEHLVINSFVFGTTYWISSLFLFLSFFFNSVLILTYLISLITFVLTTYLYKKIFKSGIFKSFLGVMLTYIPIYLLGILIQIIIFITLLHMR